MDNLVVHDTGHALDPLGVLLGLLGLLRLLNYSRLLKDFRKMKYAMPCYASLGKIN
jgi:hypothetical protein